MPELADDDRDHIWSCAPYIPEWFGPREWDIFCRFHRQKESAQSIATFYGISRTRVYQIVKRAKRRLVHPRVRRYFTTA